MKSDRLFEQTYFNSSQSGSLGSKKAFLKELKGKKFKSNPSEWLIGQDAYTLHKGVRKRFPRRRVVVSGIDDQFQADLIDMHKFQTANHANQFILTVIDVFSKFAWALPLKNKSGKGVAKALSQIFQHRKCRTLQTDKGKEFYNRDVSHVLQSYKVHHFSTENDDIKGSVVERFNQTLQKKLYRWFTKHRTSNWDSILQSVVEGYNKTTHSSIKMAPINVTHENEEDVWHILYQPTTTHRKESPHFRTNDSVRISKYKHVFSKGYDANWSTEIFLIHKILSTHPITYQLRDQNSEVIVGSYYKEELQRVKPSDTFHIENIISTRKRKGKTQYLVKWKDYPTSSNSWIDKSQLV